MRQLFAVHPSVSPAVGVPALARLYGVPLSRCVTWDEVGQLGRKWEDYLHLYVSLADDYPNLGRFL